jgi:hypothetical protein
MTTSASPTRHDHPAGRPAPAIPAQRKAPVAEAVVPEPDVLAHQEPAAVWGVVAGMAAGAAGTLVAAAIVAAPAVVASEDAARQVPEPRFALGGNVSVPGRESTTFGDGTWQVGVDVVPGTYATVGGGDCRHALRPAATGRDIVHSAVGLGPATVILADDGSWFWTSGCGTWTRVG